ncbi:MAG: hypothetical protein WC460_04075 [Patescibacteria group bacterium]
MPELVEVISIIVSDEEVYITTKDGETTAERQTTLEEIDITNIFMSDPAAVLYDTQRNAIRLDHSYWQAKFFSEINRDICRQIAYLALMKVMQHSFLKAHNR